MARYTDAVCRICRRNGEKLFLKGDRCFTPKCGVERRPTPPGQRSARRRRVSDRGMQLREKQKARQAYGLLERAVSADVPGGRAPSGCHGRHSAADAGAALGQHCLSHGIGGIPGPGAAGCSAWPHDRERPQSHDPFHGVAHRRHRGLDRSWPGAANSFRQ